jgi:dTDP-4-dehydrorhamnose reductase
MLGGSGLVGGEVRKRWADDVHVDAPRHHELDVLDENALEPYLDQTDADTVLNLVGWADVDGAEAQRGDTGGGAYRLNVEFPQRLARRCQTLRKHLIHVSTDYVFGGENAHRPYTEEDEPRPLSWYAETKLAGERAVLDSAGRVCVARIEMPFTGRSAAKRDLARLIARRLQSGQSVQGVVDQRITPVFLDYAADAFRKLAESRYVGIIHVAASDWTTPYLFARAIAQRLGLDGGLIQEVPFERFVTTRPARRPQHSWLDVRRFEREFGDDTLKPMHEELDAWVEQFLSVASRT